MIKVSVIVPVYNGENTICAYIDSLLCQRGAELEIIAVNDGSSDQTLRKLNAYGEKIKVISISNSGVAGARNAGLVQEFRFCTELKTAEDALFSLAAFTNAKSAEFISDILYEYTQSGDGMTGSDQKKNISIIGLAPAMA